MTYINAAQALPVVVGWSAVFTAFFLWCVRLAAQWRREEFIPLNGDVVDAVAEVDADMLTALNKRQGITS